MSISPLPSARSQIFKTIQLKVHFSFSLCAKEWRLWRYSCEAELYPTVGLKLTPNVMKQLLPPAMDCSDKKGAN